MEPEPQEKYHRLMAGRGVEDANEQFQYSLHGMDNDRTPFISPFGRPTSIQDEVELGAVESSRGKTSFGLSVFNLMNAVLGSGLLGLPYAMAKSGIVLFSLMLLVVAVTANYSIHLLLKMCDPAVHKSYEDIGFSALNVPGKLMAAFSVLFQNTGAMASYLFIVKTELPDVIRTLLNADYDEYHWYLNGDYLILLIVCLVILPLACLPKIGFLGYTSAFSILCMVFFTVVIIIKKFSFPCPIPVSPGNATTSESGLEEDHCDDPHEGYGAGNSSDQCSPKYFIVNLQTAYTIPTMAFSFVCHTALIPIYAELSRPSKGRMQNVAITSLSICYTLYLTAALFGYLTFYDATTTEVLHGYDAYDSADLIILIVRIAFVIAILFTIPMVHYPDRIALMMIIGTIFPPCSRFSWKLYFASTFTLLTVVTLLAIFVPNIREIFGIIGATASTSLVFFLPSLFYLKLGKEPLRSRAKILALCLFIASIAILILSLGTIIYGMIS